MKTLLLSTAAALSLSGAAFAQAVTTPGAALDVGVSAAAAPTTGALNPTVDASAAAAASTTVNPPATMTNPAAAAGASASTAAAPATTATAAATFTDAEVSKIASVATETRRLNAEGQAKIAAAATPEDKTAATTALQTSLQAAVTAQGLTVARYNEIAKAAAADPALTARISSASAASQGTSAPASTTAPE